MHHTCLLALHLSLSLNSHIHLHLQSVSFSSFPSFSHCFLSVVCLLLALWAPLSLNWRPTGETAALVPLVQSVRLCLCECECLEVIFLLYRLHTHHHHYHRCRHCQSCSHLCATLGHWLHLPALLWTVHLLFWFCLLLLCIKNTVFIFVSTVFLSTVLSHSLTANVRANVKTDEQ